MLIMTIDNRIQETEQRFNTKRDERQKYLDAAEACLTEMNHLQGEYRVLQDLKKEKEESAKKPNKKATVIEAVPEES